MTVDPELVKIIDQKIDEKLSKAIETIQLSLLKDNFLTRDDFLKAMEKIDARFEAMDKRFEAMQEQMDKRFEQMGKRFEAMQEQMDKRFEKVYERFDQMDFGHKDIVAGVAYIVVKREFRARGIDFELKSRHHFTDEDYFVHPDSQDVEIDIFHVKPNIIGETTLKISDIEKVRSFIRKIQFIEKRYKDKFKKYFFCYSINDPIKPEVESLLKRYDIELIGPERE